MLTPPKILVVEDEPAMAELIALNLRYSGFLPVWAPDAAAAHRELEDGQPDLILLDRMLPDDDGIDVLRQWRADARTRRVPVVMVTVCDSEDDRLAGFDAGADDYVTKPFSTQELMARVRVVLQGRGAGSGMGTEDKRV